MSPKNLRAVVSETALYRPLNDPQYRPAWRDATIADANIVLEGGSMRCLFTAGVLDYFMDEGLLPQRAIGVSAGALVGYNYVAGMRGRSLYVNATYCKSWRYFSIPSFLFSGNILNASFAFDKLQNNLDPFDFDGYRASPLNLEVVCCNIETGEVVYAPIDDPVTDVDFVKASAYLPLVSRTVHINGKKYLDGGMVDSVPFVHSQQTGVKKHVIILTQDAQYVKKPQASLPFVRIFYRRYPEFVQRIADRHLVYNEAYQEVVRQHETGEVFVIRPPVPVTISNMERDPKKILDLHAVGYEEARKTFKAMTQYLEE